MTDGREDQLRTQRIVALLEHNIRTELDVQLPRLAHDVSDDVRTRIAEGIAAEILYAFDVDWAPDWIHPGGVHSWQEDDSWHARCGSCLQDSPAKASREGAVRWATKHQARHQASQQ